jgi:tRNA (guanosine-2'-O-)-methyltransferase
MTPEREEKIGSVLGRRQGDLAVVLENVFDPHNVAAVMRTCDAIGIQEVYAISDRIPLRKNWGYRSSRSANKWVDLHVHTDREACIREVRDRYGSLWATCIGEGIPSIFETDLTQPMALVFGNEKFGVSEEMRAASDGLFMIPQMGMIHSLNVSVACAVTLYEAMRQKMLAGHYDGPRLSGAEQDSIRARWSENQG